MQRPPPEDERVVTVLRRAASLCEIVASLLDLMRSEEPATAARLLALLFGLAALDQEFNSKS